MHQMHLEHPKYLLRCSFVWYYLYSILHIFDRFVDVGVYGVPKTKDFDSKHTTRRIEEFVRKTKGYVYYK